MGYVVTAPLVVVKDGQGHYHHIYGGAPFPEFASEADRDRFLDEKLIAPEAEAVEDVAPPQDALPAKSAKKDVWVAYAIAKGMPEAEAKAAKKEGLVERFTSTGDQPPADQPPPPPADDPDKLTD